MSGKGFSLNDFWEGYRKGRVYDRARVISVINEKGGLGKSNICSNLGSCLANELGRKVLLIDTDGQRANLSYMLGVDKTDDLLTMFDVLMKSEDAEKAIVKISDNLHIIPATVQLSAVNQAAKITRMKKAIEGLKADYDYIIIDPSPSPCWMHTLILAAADGVLIPMEADVTCLEANRGIAETIFDIQDINAKLYVLGIVFNKYKGRRRLTGQVQQVANAMAEDLDTKIFDSIIRDTAPLAECVARHIGVTEYAPKSDAAQDIRNFVAEFEREVAAHG